jgi:hypothetical protein
LADELLAALSDWSLLPQSVAAVATTAAAIAAWKSATASRRTSQDALAALAVSLRPRLWIDVWGDYVSVENRSEWDALKVDVDVLMIDGSHLREAQERLKPMTTREGQRTDERIVVLFDPGPVPRTQRVEKVTVRYSDSRQIARYELVRTYGSAPSAITDDQISGP